MLCVILFLSLFYSKLSAQVTIKGVDNQHNIISSFFSLDGLNNEQEAIVRHVKLLDQFMHRFNLEQNIKGERLQMPDSLLNEMRQDSIFDLKYKSTRRLMLLSLFDRSSKSVKDTLLLNSMLDFIIDNNVYISLTDQTWEAETKVLVNVDKKADTLTLKLQNISVGDSAAKWIIIGAEASFLQIPASSGNTFIQPLAHETNFLELKRIFTHYETFEDVVVTNRMQDGLMLLRYFMSQKKIDFLRNLETKYLFYHFPGYVFHVEEAKRQNGNSGWLITKIEKNK